MQRSLIAGLMVGATLLAASCGDDSGDDASASTTEAVPATTESAPETTEASPDTTDATPETTEASPETTGAAPETTEATTDEVPSAVVSLSPTLTEMMFAIGAGDLLIAVDDSSNYPPEALDLPHEISAFEPNVEAIAGYEPDLVLISGDFTGLGDQLADLGIEIWDGPAAVTIDDTYRQIEELGALTGHNEEAAELVTQMQTDIDEIVVGVPDTDLTYYHELDPTYYSVTSDTFIGAIYSMVGLTNIADESGDESGGYPQLNAEYIVDADPDLIFLADTKCCDESADTVGARAGWDAIAAVQNGNVVEMDDDISSRWGPRVVDYLQAVADAVVAAQ